MINKEINPIDFADLELAESLKEKNLSELIGYSYYRLRELVISCGDKGDLYHKPVTKDWETVTVPAPSLNDIYKFLREDWIIIDIVGVIYDFPRYEVKVYNAHECITVLKSEYLADSYEEALLVGLKLALKLI